MTVFCLFGITVRSDCACGSGWTVGASTATRWQSALVSGLRWSINGIRARLKRWIWIFSPACALSWTVSRAICWNTKNRYGKEAPPMKRGLFVQEAVVYYSACSLHLTPAQAAPPRSAGATQSWLARAGWSGSDPGGCRTSAPCSPRPGPPRR